MTKKVLIVDDSPTDAAIVKDLLESEGIEVYVAVSGEEGEKKALNIDPDLIILDLVLPDKSGFEVCTQLRKEVNLSKTIIVIMSIKDRMEDITRAFDVGADDYLIKPAMHEFMIRKIMLYLGIRK